MDKSNNSFLVSATLTSLCFVTDQANREGYWMGQGILFGLFNPVMYVGVDKMAM